MVNQSDNHYTHPTNMLGSARKFKPSILFPQKPQPVYAMKELIIDKILHAKELLAPKNYNEYITTSIEDCEMFWDALLDAMDFKEDDIIDWQLDSLTLEQLLLLQNYPDRFPTFASEYVHILAVRYNTPKVQNLCQECASFYCKVDGCIERTTYTRFYHAEKIVDFIRDPQQWCNICKKRALFRMSNVTEQRFFQLIDVDGSHQRTFEFFEGMGSDYNMAFGVKSQVRKTRDNEFIVVRPNQLGQIE